MKKITCAQWHPTRKIKDRKKNYNIELTCFTGNALSLEL